MLPLAGVEEGAIGALLFLALVVSVLGAAFPVEVSDNRGQVILIAAEPQRVVVAGVALYAEILVDLGIADRVVWACPAGLSWPLGLSRRR